MFLGPRKNKVNELRTIGISSMDDLPEDYPLTAPADYLF
jgi:hypothetical protein